MYDLLFLLSYLFMWTADIAYFVALRSAKSWTDRAPSLLTIGSFILLTIGLVLRSLEAGHWPITNRYEVSLCITWTILGIQILLELSWREGKRAGGFTLIPALILASYALTRPTSEQEILPLLPALRSIWLQIHVLSTLIGYGAFCVAAGLSLTRLVQERMGTNPMSTRFPPMDQIERTMERAIALGFPWLSLGILTGGIWAQNAWGRYWGWDPKETWSLITWLWYLLILHVRTLRLWRGRRLAMLVLAGFGVVMFTFIGVPWLVRIVRLESLHGF
jgi:cytochrome c-type biogenesis protein CcsB